nr:uncharacterized protein PF11_0213-like isoform X2 [Onthophagus taurus]
METLWRVLCVVLGLICAQLCNGLPINLTTSGPDVQTQYFTGFVAVLLAICSVVLLAGCICCRRNKNGFTEFRDSPVAASVASNLDHGHSNPIANSEFTIFTPISPAHHNNNVFLANQRIVNRTPDDFKYGDIEVSSWFDGSEKDFPRTRLKYIRELGKGWFGRVVEGTAQGLNQDPSEPEWTPVVVRILNASATPKGRVMFLHDVDVYRHGYHPNILRLWGRCLDTTPLLLLQEYCTEGDLKKYLRSMKPTKEKFLSTDLPLLWCYQLTQALKFLHEQKVPHPDLASRNCQLTKDLTLKLGDYGLNSSFYPEDYYDMTLTIPLRWCAPEIISYTNTTIQTKKITLEGNIWSLGVTMWEILECGDQPYSDLNNDEVISQVLGSPNVRLPRPTVNVIYTDYMYKLMQSCWSTVESRLSATHIDLILNDLMQVYEHTKVSTELKDCSIHDFDQRWEALKPNAVAMTDETPLMHEEKKSASLTNLHGSLDNLLQDHNSVDSWLENVANNSGDLVYAKGLSEAMMDLDNVLELNSNNPSPKPLHFKIGPKVTTSSESETEEENWKKKIERGAYTEKVRQKSRSVADLMVLTHVDYSESDSETLPSLTEFKNQKSKFKNMDNPALKFGSEGNLLSVHDTFQEELRKLQDERRDSLLFVPDKYSYSDSKSGESSSSRQLDSLENSPVKKLLVELNSPAEIIPAKQVYNVFNVSVKHLNSLVDNKDDRVNLQKKTSCDSLKESKDNKDVIHIKNGISCDNDHTKIPSNLDLKPKSLENLSDFHVKIEVLSDQSSPVDEEIASQEELDRPGSSDDYIKETRKLNVPKLSELIQRNDNLKPDREDKLLTKFSDKDLIDKDSGLNTPENSASLEKLYDDIEEILDEPSVLKKCSKCAISFEDNDVYTGSFDSDKSNDLKVDLHKDLCLLKEEIKVSSSEGSGCEEDSGTGTSSKETQSIDDNLSAKSLEDTLDTINNDYCLRRSKIICESFLANEKSNYSPTDEYREICFETNTKFKEDVTKDVHQIISAHLIPDLLTDLPDVDKHLLNKEKKLETLSEYLLKPLIHINLDTKSPNNLNLTKTSLILPIIKSNSPNDKESESESDSVESVAEFLSPEISQASDFKTISECSIENNASQALAVDNSVPNTMLDVSSDEMKTLEEGDSSKTLGGDSDADLNVEEFVDCQTEINEDTKLTQEKQRDILRKTKEFLCQELVFYDKDVTHIKENVKWDDQNVENEISDDLNEVQNFIGIETKLKEEIDEISNELLTQNCDKQNDEVNKNFVITSCENTKSNCVDTKNKNENDKEEIKEVEIINESLVEKIETNDSINLDGNDIESCDTKMGDVEQNDSSLNVSIKRNPNNENNDESFINSNKTYQFDVQDTSSHIVKDESEKNVLKQISTVDVEEIIIEIINKVQDISSLNNINETSPQNNKSLQEENENTKQINFDLTKEELNFNETIVNKTKDFLNNEIKSYIETPQERLKVQFDLSDSQEEIAPSSLTHFQGFSSTPYSKKRKPLESTILDNDDYSIDFYSTSIKETGSIKGEDLKFSSNFIQEPRETNNSDLYSLETWDNFLGKSFDEQENDIDFITFNQEPHSLLFLENNNEGLDEKLDKKNNLQVSHVLNETYVPDTKNEDQTFNKDVPLNKTYDESKIGDGTFVVNNDTFVKDGNGTFIKEETESEMIKPSTSTGWESGGGWFLHPQSNSEELSGQIAVQADSYVGFSMDDEIMAAIRNELLNKLPHAQRASSEQIEEREELEPAEKNEVFIRYNVYNTPLSPIPEESYIDSDDDSPIFTNKRNEESDDDSCDWSIEDNISSNIHTEINSPKPESSMISSPAKIPNHRHTPSLDSCCSNDTLFNVEDLNLTIEPDRIFETIPDEDESSKESKESKYSDCKAEIEDNTLIDDQIEKEQIPKINVNDYITDFLNNERYNQLNSCIELIDLRSENDERSSSSDKFLTVSDNTLSFGQNIAPLNSPEDRQWKDLQASFRNCDETPEHPKTYLSPIENPDYDIIDEKCTNFELVTDLDDPELDNIECHISDEDIDKVLQEENELIPENKEETSRNIPVADNLSINLDKENISSSRTEDNASIIYVNTASKLEEGEGNSLNADSDRTPSDVTDYDGINKNEDSPEYVYVEKHEDNHEYENGWIADTIYANMPADRAKELDYVIAEENKKKAEEKIEDLYGPLADIRFSGPGLANLQMMSTSFSESNEVGDEQDWDSGSDTRSSSSGEFIWREGEHEASLKALDAAPQSENAQESLPMEDIQEENELSSSDSDCEGECPEFVPSAWDKYAIPTKSALRSPEKTFERKDPKDKKAVWFKKQKYHCIYEYPKEPESPNFQSYDLWKPATDYSTLADWEYGPDLYTPRYDLIDPLSSTSDQQQSPKSLYHLTAFPEKEPTVLDEDFLVSSSSKPFDMLGGTTSQFFPGKQFSDHWIDEGTPDCEDILTPVIKNDKIPSLKHLAGIVVNKNRKSRELGGLRHTRSKLKLDLPPSPSAFSSNTTFNVEQPAEEIVRRQVPTFSTFGKSRFLVQHVDTPPDDKLESKNVSFEALPYKPQTVKERQAIESVRGEASLLDSADEDSGIESNTLERGKKIGT